MCRAYLLAQTMLSLKRGQIPFKPKMMTYTIKGLLCGVDVSTTIDAETMDPRV